MIDILMGKNGKIPRSPSEDEEDFGVMRDRQLLLGTSRDGRSREASPLGPSERMLSYQHTDYRLHIVLGSRVMGEQVFVVCKPPSLWSFVTASPNKWRQWTFSGCFWTNKVPLCRSLYSIQPLSVRFWRADCIKSLPWREGVLQLALGSLHIKYLKI